MNVRCTFDKMVEISKLKPHPKNRNKHSKDQIERLAKILNYQGWRYPIKVSKQSGFITSGHGRLAAARKLNLKKVPVNFQEYESKDQEYADLQSDNAIASWAELDVSGVVLDLKGLDKKFNKDLLGFKDFVLNLGENNSDVDDKENKEKEGLHFLEVECSNEKELVEVYEDLLSRGIIVRYK